MSVVTIMAVTIMVTVMMMTILIVIKTTNSDTGAYSGDKGSASVC